jgi:hypothetical protein
MEKQISWIEIVRLLLTYAPEAVMFILKKLKANGPVTSTELDELLTMVSKPGNSYFKG